MATIKEIAELAGVSRGTVDRVLNNRGAVNPKTARKVLEIAQALDYKPNRAGIVLAAQKKNLKIGVILFDTGNPFFNDVIEGVNKKAEELGGYNCSVLISRVGFDLQAQLDAMDRMAAQGVNGIVLSPYNDPLIAGKINELSEKGIPVITTNTDIENSARLAYVGCNFYRSGETAAGFRDRVQSHYPGIHIVDTIENSDDEFESYDGTLRLLGEHPEINALYFAAGGVYGGCRAVLASGRRDITIISCDKVPTTRDMVLQGVIAATICQQPLIQGTRPLDLMFSCLTTGEKPEKEYHYTTVDIRIRENI